MLRCLECLESVIKDILRFTTELFYCTLCYTNKTFLHDESCNGFPQELLHDRIHPSFKFSVELCDWIKE